jgi:hypothetical protein
MLSGSPMTISGSDRIGRNVAIATGRGHQVAHPDDAGERVYEEEPLDTKNSSQQNIIKI